MYIIDYQCRVLCVCVRSIITHVQKLASTLNFSINLPHTAGSSRQEAWFETVTKGVPLGLFRVAFCRISRFLTWIFWPPPNLCIDSGCLQFMKVI